MGSPSSPDPLQRCRIINFDTQASEKTRHQPPIGSDVVVLSGSPTLGLFVSQGVHPGTITRVYPQGPCESQRRSHLEKAGPKMKVNRLGGSS